MGNEVKIRVTGDDDTSAATKTAKSNVKSLANEVDTAAKKVAQARNLEETAAGRVRIAEARLAEVRDSGNAKASHRVAVEESLAAAQRNLTGAQDDATRSTLNLAAARDKAAAAAEHEKAAEKAAAEASGGGNAGDKDVVALRARVKNLGAGLASEFKTAGIQAGAAFAGALGAGLTPVAAAGLFVGIAAASQSSNQVVAGAYKDLWERVKQGAKDTSSSLSGEFISGAETLGATFSALEPQLTRGFRAARPVVNDLFDGVSRMAQTALPGLVIAAEQGDKATKGLADMLQSAGQGVANFFTESSRGAAAGGDAFRALGNIIERLGSFAGRIFAELAGSSSTVFPQLEHTIDAAADTVENFAHVALPGIAAGAGLALSGLGLLMNLANSLIGALGPLVPLAGTFATSLKLIDMVSFGQVGKSWDALKTSIGEAEGFAGKAKAGFSSLLTSGFLPLMVGGVALTGLLNELSADQQRAAEATKAHEQNVSNLADALRKSKGAMDDNVRAAAAQSMTNLKVGDTGKSVLKVAQELGVSLPNLTTGWLGNKGAMQEVNDQLDLVIKNGTDYVETETAKQAIMSDAARDAYNLKRALASGNTELAEAILKNEAMASATGKTTVATSRLSDEFATLSDKASSAEQKVSALVTIMDTMAGRKPDVEEATKAWEELVDSFNKEDGGFAAANAGTKKWASSLIDAQGNIKLTTEDGRKLFDLVRNAEKDFATTGQAMRASGASADEVNARLQVMRDEFLGVAQKMGFTAGQAELMANKFGLVPRNVSVLVSSNLAPEIQKAIDLGGQIRSLPNGYISVTANTDPARNSITSLIQDSNGRVITIRVNTVSGTQTNTTVTSGGSVYRSRLKASGGPVGGHAAEGGPRYGVTQVNEQGLELFRTPRGDFASLEPGGTVIPHGQSMQMLAGAGGQLTVMLVPSPGLEGTIMGAVVRGLRAEVQRNGGSVDRLLGGNRK